jgi:hypothetical protein
MSEDTSGRGFSHDEERALASVLDEIIPPSGDGRLPGAGELGLAGYIEQTLQKTPEFRPAIAQGLSTLDDLARSRGSERFAVPGLIFHAYAGYYQNGRVVEALGLEPRPPHPKGYEIEPSDLTLLDGVRQRPALYRKC